LTTVVKEYEVDGMACKIVKHVHVMAAGILREAKRAFLRRIITKLRMVNYSRKD
jgi:hypothetical protein